MSPSMMDLTDIQEEIEDAEEPTVAETGEEHHLQIISCGSGTSDKNDCDWFSPVFEVIDKPMVKEFNTFFWVPDKDKLTEKQYKRALYSIQVFSAAFGIDLSQAIDFDDDLPGKKGWAILGSKKDDEYGEKNTIRSFVTPK